MRPGRRSARRRGVRASHAPSLAGVLAAVRTHHADADLALVRHAHDEAARWHAGRFRRSGDPYVTHCVAVAAIVAELGMPTSVVCAALLHDIEDTSCPPGRVAARFGEDIAELVVAARNAQLGPAPSPGTTPSSALPDVPPSRTEAVLAIRLADRLHNMRTIAYLAPATRHRKARETLDVLAPLAGAVGLTDVSRELHELSSAVLRRTPLVWAIPTLLLPAGHRGRWREEWQAEMGVLTGRRARARFTVRVLLRTPRLSLTLRRPAGREQRRW
ncbi:HD domain-containing protein [Streptomyces sp. 7R007]